MRPRQYITRGAVAEARALLARRLPPCLVAMRTGLTEAVCTILAETERRYAARWAERAARRPPPRRNADRDAAIRLAFASGESASKLALRYQVTLKRIRQIVDLRGNC